MEIKTLNRKSMYGLALLICNAGHMDYYYYNVASVFAEIVEGAPVIASDGTEELFPNGKIESTDDSSFTELSEEKRGIGNGRIVNDGFVVYQDTGLLIETYKTGVKETTVQELLEVLYAYI